MFLYLVKNLQCLFNVVYKVVYRSELVNQNINFYILLHTTADLTFGKPVNISSLEQQQSKGLDIPPGGRLEGNKARGYTRARTTQSVRRFNKAENNLQQVIFLSQLHYYEENLGQLTRYIRSDSTPLPPRLVQPFYTFTLIYP